jgi:hypothetical protein
MFSPKAPTDGLNFLEGFPRLLLGVMTGVLAVCSIACVVLTAHWPMVQDAATMHYAVFLIERGWTPYRDFQDVNMPGSYLVTGVAMHLLGPGNLGWRLFDLSLMAAAAAAYWAIARPYSRFAALWAAALLLVVHARDGIQQAGQRDLVMAVLELAAVAFLLLCLRQRRWWLMVPFGLCMGLASTIKPTAGPLGLALLALGVWQWRRSAAEHHGPAEHQGPRRVGAGMWTIGLAGLLAMLAPIAGVLGVLALWGALGSFWWIVHTLIPYYSSLDRQTAAFLLTHSVAPLMVVVALWMGCLLGGGRPRLAFERAALWVCAIAGLASYVVQGKGLTYHRYPLLTFLLLLMAIDLVAVLRQPHWTRYLAAAALLFGVGVVAPVSLVKLARYDWRNQELTTMIDDDLERLGGQHLNRQVQCVDSVRGCVDALYAARLEPATPLLSDEVLLGTEPSRDGYAVIRQTRADFLQRIETRPPKVFVVISGLFLENSDSFEKLQGWPVFANFLATHYRLETERQPPHAMHWWLSSMPAPRYRIYVLR